jgi:hypothetical protein
MGKNLLLRRGGAWRALAARLATLAVLFQCFIVQPHVDFHGQNFAAAALASATPAGPTALDRHKDGPAQTPCLICQAAALTGGMLLNAPPALAPLHGGFIATAAVRVQPVFVLSPSHAWRSRAPPSLI